MLALGLFLLEPAVSGVIDDIVSVIDDNAPAKDGQ